MTGESPTTASSIPDDWMETGLSSSGFLPSVGVHRRGNTVVQETSRSVWIGAFLMCCFALLALIPLSSFGIEIPHENEFPSYLRILIACGLAWGAICAVAVNTFSDHYLGVTTTLDLNTQILVVRRSDRIIKIPVNRIIGLQILRGPKRRGPQGDSGYQLNLVFRQESGEVSRESLHTNTFRCYVVRIAKAYHRFAGLPILEAQDGGPEK